MPMNYRLLEDRPLGSGPSGSFWKYQDMASGELVAIKRIDPGTAMDVEAEIKALKAIKAKPHSAIVQLICATAEEVEGIRFNFIVYQYMPGGTLRDVINGLKLIHVDYVRSIASQITDGLDHLHNVVNLWHGDIKPENILFKDQEMTRIAIADHRLALSANINEGLKMTIIAGGTTEYLAYEVWKRSELGKPMDMWSLGIIIYEMITHLYPFNSHMAKRMKEKIKDKLKFVTPSDLSSRTRNPLLEASEEASAEARKTIEETMERGVDWTLFPVDDDYDVAKSFVDSLLNINSNERMTAKQALGHQFINSVYIQLINSAHTYIRPAGLYPSAKGGTSQLRPPASAPLHPSRPGSIRVVGAAGLRTSGSPVVSRKRQPKPESLHGFRMGDSKEKLMRSEFTGKKLDRISLRSVSSRGDTVSSLEDLSFWKRHDYLVSKTPPHIKTLLVLSVRAGFTIGRSGRIKLVVPGRNLDDLESILQNFYKIQMDDRSVGSSRQSDLTSITEEAESEYERSFRSGSPKPLRGGEEFVVGERAPPRSRSSSGHRNGERSHPPYFLEVHTPHPSRPASVTGVTSAVPAAVRPPSVHETHTLKTPRPASDTGVPPVSTEVVAEAPANVDKQEQTHEQERAPSPVPSKHSATSRKTRESTPKSRHSSRQPSQARSATPTKKSENVKPESRSRTRPASISSKRSRDSKKEEKETKTDAKEPADTAVVESPQAETAPAPPAPAPPPAAETTPAAAETKSTKKHTKPASIRSVKTDVSTRTHKTVGSTASHKKKARKLADVPARSSSTPPTSRNSAPPPPPPVPLAATSADTAIVESPQAEIAPTPPAPAPAPPPAVETTLPPAETKSPKKHTKPASIRSVKTDVSARTHNTVRSTASHKNKARKLADVPARSSSTPPTSRNSAPSPPPPVPLAATSTVVLPPPPATAEASGTKEEAVPGTPRPESVHSAASKSQQKQPAKQHEKRHSRAASVASSTARDDKKKKKKDKTQE